MLEEGALHSFKVAALGGLYEPQASLGEMGQDGAGVRLHAFPLDQAASLKGVDDAGDAAEAQPALIGEVRQPQRASRGTGQPTQRLQGAERQAVLRFKLGVKRSDEALACLQQTDPRVGVNVGPAGKPVLTEDVRAGVRGRCFRCCLGG